MEQEEAQKVILEWFKKLREIEIGENMTKEDFQKMIDHVSEAITWLSMESKFFIKTLVGFIIMCMAALLENKEKFIQDEIIELVKEMGIKEKGVFTDEKI